MVKISYSAFCLPTSHKQFIFFVYTSTLTILRDVSSPPMIVVPKTRLKATMLYFGCDDDLNCKHSSNTDRKLSDWTTVYFR